MPKDRVYDTAKKCFHDMEKRLGVKLDWNSFYAGWVECTQFCMDTVADAFMDMTKISKDDDSSYQ